MWDKDYGGPAEDWLRSLALTDDGGYLLAGDSYSTSGGDKTESNIGAVQTWIIKTDSVGNKQWDKTIFANGTVTTANAFQTKDGCYAIGSYTWAEVGWDKSQSTWDSSVDYWIVKFCDTLLTGVTELTQNVNLTVYPNPFTNDIAIAIQKQGLIDADFAITDMLGRQIYTQHETNLSSSYTKMLDLSYLPSGVYLLRIEIDGERVVKEIVKE